MKRARKRGRVRKRERLRGLKRSISKDLRVEVSTFSRRRGLNEFTLNHRAEMILKCLQLYPLAVSKGLAKNPEANWLFGCLYLVGALNRNQYDACDRLDRITRRYRALLMPHTRIRGFNPEFVQGNTGEDLSPLASARLQKATEQYVVYYTTLKAAGTGVVEAIFKTLDKDLPTDLDLIRLGLDALVKETQK